MGRKGYIGSVDRRCAKVHCAHIAIIRPLRRMSEIDPKGSFTPPNLAPQTGRIGTSTAVRRRAPVHRDSRLVLRSPRILVFDEASSMLDRRTEAEILCNPRKLSAGRTAVSV